MFPKAILPIRIGDKTIDYNIQRTVLSFFRPHSIVFCFGALIVASMGYDMQSAIGASIDCLGNIGPRWGEFSPIDNYAQIPVFGKWVLMIIGRLEIFTVLLIFS